ACLQPLCREPPPERRVSRVQHVCPRCVLDSAVNGVDGQRRAVPLDQRYVGAGEGGAGGEDKGGHSFFFFASSTASATKSSHFSTAPRMKPYRASMALAYRAVNPAQNGVVPGCQRISSAATSSPFLTSLPVDGPLGTPSVEATILLRKLPVSTGIRPMPELSGFATLGPCSRASLARLRVAVLAAYAIRLRYCSTYAATW